MSLGDDRSVPPHSILIIYTLLERAKPVSIHTSPVATFRLITRSQVQILPPQPRKQQLDQRVSCKAKATQQGGFLLCDEVCVVTAICSGLATPYLTSGLPDWK